MRKYIVIILTILLALPVSGKKRVSAPSLSIEQEQQFTYYWYAARQAIDNNRYPEAYTLLQFCNELQPNDAQTLYYLGVMQKALLHEDEAKASFEQAYAVSKGDAPEEVLEQLLNIYFEEMNWKKAIEIRDVMDAKNGYDAMSALTRYRIYAMNNKTKLAIKAVEDYLKTDPDNLQFLLFRIEILEHIGAKPKVLYSAYERVIELDPYNLQTLNNYAYHLSTHGGDLTKAERMSAITIREQPNNPVYLDTYGWILHLKGENELAKFYLRKALQYTNAEEIQKHLEAIK